MKKRSALGIIGNFSCYLMQKIIPTLTVLIFTCFVLPSNSFAQKVPPPPKDGVTVQGDGTYYYWNAHLSFDLGISVSLPVGEDGADVDVTLGSYNADYFWITDHDKLFD